MANGKFTTKYNLARQRFGRLSVVEEAPRRGRDRVWHCACDCGNSSIVYQSSLIRGRIVSCGCHRNEQSGLRSQARRKPSRNAERTAYRNMVDRCTNPENVGFHNYGGRGITICDRWLESFDSFYNDVGPRPTPKHSIDRVENSGNYEPSNVKWSTKVEQTNNTRTNRRITFEGRTLTMSQWAVELGVPLGRIKARLKLGWSVHKTFTEPKVKAHWSNASKWRWSRPKES